VLVADDSPALRTVVRIIIESQGWTVAEATGGADALARARADLPDLVLLDLEFGANGPHGFNVLTALRADPRTAAIPVVILSASAAPGDPARARELGATAFLAKPFGPLDLIAVLERARGG
jgi:CheY-like chemotaxis protein